MKLSLVLTTALFSLVFSANAQNSSPYWSLAGNSNASSSSKLGTNNNISLRFYTNNVERMIINSTWGLVGIGTSSPGFKLDVVGGSYSGIRATTASNFGVSGTSSSSDGYGVYGVGYYGVRGIGDKYGVHGSSTNNGYGVYGATNTNYVDGYAVTGVYGTGYYGVKGIGGVYGIYGSGTAGVYATSVVPGGDGLRSIASGTSAYAIYAYSANSIGIYASTGNSSSYAGYFSGDLFCSGTYLPSDLKLKNNITTFNNAMNLISKLQPKTYEYRDDQNLAKMNLPTGTHYGFIAQDLENVLPNLVKQTQLNTAKSEVQNTSNAVKGETIDFKAINYIELIPIMVKAMQEQQSQFQQSNAEKDKKIADLQNQINDLKSLILKNNNSSTTTSLSGYLKQNTPNPSNNSTIISYYTPDNSGNAQILVTDMKGSVLKAYTASKGQGQVNINYGELPTGTYNYTLYVNSIKIDTKQMVVIK